MIHEKSVTLKQLRALAAIVAEGNLAAAADSLHVTGPAVSTQLRTLEANLGAQTLIRGPGGKVEPTAVGREVLAAAAQVESALDACFARIRAVQAGRAGRVSLGVVSTGKYFAPGLTAQAKQALPQIEIGLRIGNRDEIIEALRRREVDMAIMGRPPRDPPVEADVLGDHPHVVIAAPDHPLAGRRDISPERLLEETFLTREPGSGTRILMERFLDRIGDGRVYDQVRMGTNETIKQAVMAGLGVAFISGHTIQAELESGRLVTLDLEGLPVMRKWFLVRRADREPEPVSATIRAFVLELQGSFLPDLRPPAPAARPRD